MDYLERVYQKSPHLVYRKIAGEFVLVPIRKNVGDLESIYTLNEVGARIWELIDGKRKIGKIKQKIIAEFEVSPQKAEKDLFNLIKQLESIRGINLASKK